MQLAIILAILASRNVQARAVDDTVIIEGRPGCHAEALYGDPAQPIVVCSNATLTIVK